MKAILMYDDETVIDTHDVVFWALDPSYGDGDVSISAHLVDNDAQGLSLEFLLTGDDVAGLQNAIDAFKLRYPSK